MAPLFGHENFGAVGGSGATKECSKILRRVRAAPAQNSSGIVVHPILDGSDLCEADFANIRSLREGPPYYPVRVLVAAAFPTAVWVRKVHTNCFPLPRHDFSKLSKSKNSLPLSLVIVWYNCPVPLMNPPDFSFLGKNIISGRSSQWNFFMMLRQLMLRFSK